MEKKITIQQGQTLSQIAMANKTSVKELCKINGIKNPNLIFAGQQIITNADAPKEQPKENRLNNGTAINNTKNSDSIFTGQKTTANTNVQKEQPKLNIGGEIIGTGLAVEHLAPKSDIDKLNAARKEVQSAVKANTYYTSESGRSYTHKKGPTAERQAKAYDDFVKAQKANSEAENLIKADKELNAARKEVQSAVKANTHYTSESGRSYMHKKGPTAERQAKAIEKFNKAQNAYNEAEMALKELKNNNINKTIKSIKRTRVLSKTSKVIGKAAVPVAVAAEGYNVYTEYKAGGKKAAAKQAVRSTGALAGAWAGAKGGAAAGAAIGSVFPGAGTAIGGAIGGIIGGVAGYLASDKIMKQIVK